MVIAAPLFNKVEHVETAVRSLLAQTHADFRLLLIDDRSEDGSQEICRALAAADPRVELHVNPRRLGMLGNTNRAYTLARERYPDAEFWALGSDHDEWDPRWLATMVGLLDAHPDAVLAYPQSVRIDEHGVPYDRGGKKPWRSQTLGIGGRRARLRAAFEGMVAGDMIYGLFRTAALDDVGRLYRPVLVPDRLLLSELALRGTFVQAREVLWRRRFRGLADLDRQRRAFFLDAAPRHAAWPWWAQHALALIVAYAVRGEGRPAVSRAQGAGLAAAYLQLALALRLRRRVIRGRRWYRKTILKFVHRWRKRLRPRRIVLRAADRLIVRHGARLGPALRRELVRLEARPVTRPLARRAGPTLERVAVVLNERGQADGREQD